ncbi:putative metal-binding motif-containing protein [Candidatus Woesearchaeota archaeon]|nr:putative metal-binding motif-containing protein [Candidatus Woesearchaeota archaeon]
MKRGLNIKLIVFLSFFLVSFVLLINGAFAIEDPVGLPCPHPQGGDFQCPLPESTCVHKCIVYPEGNIWGACSPGYNTVSENSASVCSNNIDDDCDGLVDCADTDCNGGDTSGNGNYDGDSYCNGIDDDKDGDGIPNRIDIIEPYTYYDKLSSVGCSVYPQGHPFVGKQIDSDNDGVCDKFDQCGDTADACLVAQGYDNLNIRSQLGCPQDCSGACASDINCGDCNSCSLWLMPYCINSECSDLGKAGNGCFYHPGILGSCSECSGNVVGCNNYLTQNDCEVNQCLNPGNLDPRLPKCEWKGKSIGCQRVEPNNYYIDNDRDGFGDKNVNPIEAYEKPTGYSDNNGDCDDNLASRYPNAPEICDGFVNDCDSSDNAEQGCDCNPLASQNTRVCEFSNLNPNQVNPGCEQTCGSDGKWSQCEIPDTAIENTDRLCSDGIDNDCDGLIDCVDSDCGGNTRDNSGNWDASQEGNVFVCDKFDDDDDNDGIKDFDEQGNILDQEQFTHLGCSVDAMGNMIDEDHDTVCDNLEPPECRGTLLTCVSNVNKNYDDGRMGCPREGACEISGCFRDSFCRQNVQTAGCHTECGDGISNTCDRDECVAISDYVTNSCFFSPNVIWSRYGDCNGCSLIGTSCSNYDQNECPRDPCKLGCEFDNINNVCKEKTKFTYYKDNDGDSYGSSSSGTKDITDQTSPEGYVSNNLDCDDDTSNDPNSVVCPTNQILCNSITSGCAICMHPRVQEICSDEKDNDCNGQIDEVGCKCDLGDIGDSDGDGIPNSVDQNDCTPRECTVVDINGNALDSDNDGVCDGKDQCSHSACSVIDQSTGCPPSGNPTVARLCSDDPYFRFNENENLKYCEGSCSDYSQEVCESDPCGFGGCRLDDNGDCSGEVVYYLDQDKDNYPDESNSIERPSVDSSNPSIEINGNKYMLSTGKFDCLGHDNDATIYPDAQEICDGKNNDCDNAVDEGCVPQAQGERESCTIEQESDDRLCSPQVGACQYSFQKCEGGFWSACHYSQDYDSNNKEVRCGDKIDNDCNNKIDCDDPNCATDANACPEQYATADSDRDGVLNKNDFEDTPIGCTVNNGGVNSNGRIIDEDIDTVCDPLDQCHGTPDGCGIITDPTKAGLGCPTTLACSESKCAVANQKCPGPETTSSGTGGQCSCKLVADACEENIIGTSAEENGLVLVCNPTEDGKPRILTGLKIIDFNDPFALKADGINKYKIKCCTLKCAES